MCNSQCVGIRVLQDSLTDGVLANRYGRQSDPVRGELDLVLSHLARARHAAHLQCIAGGVAKCAHSAHDKHTSRG